ncbi:hypothetical protein FQN53_001464 [Emmonsiellopsis sp. PD_33]|nr:hypothetical protein FQN53_001464 [Emmonsiellopsis sp. PD_33]
MAENIGASSQISQSVKSREQLTKLDNQNPTSRLPNLSAPMSQQPKLTLYRGWQDRGKYVWSPFVIKIEARLRFSGIKYDIDCGSPRTGPKGKIPYIEIQEPESDSNDSLKPTSMGDSTLIIKHLVSRGTLSDLNEKLDLPDQANDLAIRALLEDKLYFYHMWERWTQNYYAMRDHVLSAIAYPIRVIIGQLVYWNTTAALHRQGTGRYTAEEIVLFRREIWEAINKYLTTSKNKMKGPDENQRPFWVLGMDQPTDADATVFGFIVSVLVSTAAPDSQEVVKGFPVILDYARRIHDVYFPDYEKWQE